MSKVGAIFFDLDGTLVDSVTDIRNCLFKAFQKAGIIVLEFDAKFRIGPPLSEMLDVIAPELPADNKKTVSKLFRQLYDTSGFPSTCAYQGVDILLKKLREWRIPLFIVTNKPRFATQRIIEKMGWNFFVDVLTPDFQADISHSKATLLTLTCQQKVLLPKRCWMVGDLPEDIRAANTAGMNPVGVTWGYGEKKGLLAAATNVLLVTSPDEFLKIVQEGV